MFFCCCLAQNYSWLLLQKFLQKKEHFLAYYNQKQISVLLEKKIVSMLSVFNAGIQG